MRRLLLATIVSLAAAGTSVSQAALTPFFNQAAFLGAVNGPAVQDFSGIAAPGDFVSFAGTLSGGVTYGSVSDFVAVVDPGFDPEYDFGSGALLALAVADAPVVLSFGPTFAVGFLLGTFADPAGTVTVTVAGEPFEIFTGAAYPALQFIGFISDTPFTSVELSGFDSFGAVVDDFTIAIPEPFSLMLFGGGLLALGVARRRA